MQFCQSPTSEGPLNRLHICNQMGLLFRGEIAPLSSSYNTPGLVPGLLLTFSMLLTETSEIQKVCFFGTCPRINV